MRAGLIEKYVKYNHLGVSQGKLDTSEVIMPYLLMDVALSIFDKEITPLKCQHKLNHWKKEWKKAYNKFNARFFEAFDRDETDEIIDAMDGMENEIGDELAAFRTAINNCLGDVAEDERNVVGACLMIDVVAKTAITFFERNYIGRSLQMVRLQEVKDCTLMLMRLYYTGFAKVTCNYSEEVDLAATAMCMKLVKWALRKI